MCQSAHSSLFISLALYINTRGRHHDFDLDFAAVSALFTHTRAVDKKQRWNRMECDRSQGLEKWHSSLGDQLGNKAMLFSYCCFYSAKGLRIYKNSCFRKYAILWNKFHGFMIKKLRLVVKYILLRILRYKEKYHCEWVVRKLHGSWQQFLESRIFSSGKNNNNYLI